MFFVVKSRQVLFSPDSIPTLSTPLLVWGFLVGLVFKLHRKDHGKWSPPPSAFVSSCSLAYFPLQPRCLGTAEHLSIALENSYALS